MSDEPFLAATRDSYDAMVVEYADMFGASLADMPLDRALLAAFAELVRANGNGPVADVGCGPGRVTTVLRELGLDAFGIDLSPGMIELARRTYPGLRFEVGSMLALELPDAALGGLLGYYSIIHVPWERRPEVFAEFHRVLAPGGQLMLAFQVGDDLIHRDEVFGKPVDLNLYRQQPGEVSELLREAGFEPWATGGAGAPGRGEGPAGICAGPQARPDALSRMATRVRRSPARPRSGASAAPPRPGARTPVGGRHPAGSAGRRLRRAGRHTRSGYVVPARPPGTVSPRRSRVPARAPATPAGR
ncbi:methyltransferase domain-containing protein [Plantactinospora sp. CA-290183]|uniref:class I SAM-dependent methyltransferase n=1 Tax=Plantactinospora sp. CA-290183 TaxID=3240006 RepID=UPI003D8A151E